MKEKILTVLIGILYIALGIYLVTQPKETLYTFALIIGITFIIGGVLNIFNHIFKKNIKDSNLILGIIDLLFGLLLITKFLFTTTTIIYVIASFLLVRGIISLILGIMIKKEMGNFGANLIINSIFTILFSIYFFISPLITVLTITVMYGIMMILIGINIIISAFIKKEVETFKEVTIIE